MSVVMPNYERCNLNIITSILKYYGVKSNHASLPELDEKLNSKKYKNVILLVMDGMGEHI
jgi:alkaline phosphatase